MSMKIIAVIAGVVVAIVAGVLIIANTNDGTQTEVGNVDDVQIGEDAEAGATLAACDIFTDAVAVQVLGAGATKSDLPDGATTSTDDVSVSNCLYEIESGQTIETANILVRGGKTDTGRSSNDFGFHNPTDLEGNPYEVEPISGIGDEAYWNPDFGQINVYMNDGQYWIIVQYGSQGTAEQRAKSEELAKLVIANL